MIYVLTTHGGSFSREGHFRTFDEAHAAGLKLNEPIYEWSNASGESGRTLEFEIEEWEYGAKQPAQTKKFEVEK